MTPNTTFSCSRSSATSRPQRSPMTHPAPYAGAHVVAVSPDHLRRLVPFYLLIDTDGCVQLAGHALSKVLGDQDVIGRSVFDILKIVKPRVMDKDRAFRDVLGQRLKAELHCLKGAASSAMFGMAFPVEFATGSHVLLTFTPGVNARSFVEHHGLNMTDFGPVDGSADLLPLLAMQAQMLEDSQQNSRNLAAARDAAEHLANHDVLTGLPNRRALMTKLEDALAKGPVCVMHLDLDRFKEINDTYGHAAGDAALKHATKAMTELFDGQGLCARLGGDEFVAFFTDDLTDADLRDMSGALLTRLSEPFSFEKEHLTIGASIGLAMSTRPDPLTPDSILHHADLALYEVKRSGRGRIALCTPNLLHEQNAFQTLSTEIRQGLANKEFEAHLQPQVEAKSGAVLGFEALVRWNHPERGLLTPGHFLSCAERAGLIRDIDAEVRRSALDTLQLSDTVGSPLPKISLNVTIDDLIDPRFLKDLLWTLDAKDLSAERVELEIVESVLFEANSDAISSACSDLVNEGFALALDDFGTGHASVLSLMNLPISLVKIDRAFADGVAFDDRKAAMAQALVGMARTLGLEVLAEGVNTDDDVKALRDMGCEFFQSFHFGRPMAPTEALSWAATRNSCTFRERQTGTHALVSVNMSRR